MPNIFANVLSCPRCTYHLPRTRGSINKQLEIDNRSLRLYLPNGAGDEGVLICHAQHLFVCFTDPTISGGLRSRIVRHL